MRDPGVHAPNREAGGAPNFVPNFVPAPTDLN
jgi:hypothetical protein